MPDTKEYVITDPTVVKVASLLQYVSRCPNCGSESTKPVPNTCAYCGAKMENKQDATAVSSENS
jgi:rRNA maturation endonuclease Nob1